MSGRSDPSFERQASGKFRRDEIQGLGYSADNADRRLSIKLYHQTKALIIINNAIGKKEMRELVKIKRKSFINRLSQRN